MKRLLSLLVVLVVLVSALPCNAQTEYVSKGLQNTQKQYAKLISTAIEKSQYNEEQIDKEHIFIIENTSPIPMRKNEEAIWLYVALPIMGTSDISFAHFEKGEYVSEITNFVVFKNIENPYGNKLQQYIEKNNLSEPTAITNMWLIERLHLFAYKVVCNNEEYIIPYYFTEDTMFNLTNDKECNIELGKAYTLDSFLTICEKEADLFAEYRKSESEQDENNATHLDINGDIVENEKKPTITDKEEIDTTKKDNKDTETQKESDGTPARTYTFEELTGLSREDIDHIVIRSGLDGIGYSTAYEKIITDIYNTINTKSFLPYVQEGNSGGWLYEIIFFDKNTKSYSYNISIGITPESGFSGLSYRTTNEEELKAVVEKAYNLVSNDCSEWSSDYIVQAKDIGLLKDISGLVYKENITREKFCELIYDFIMITQRGITTPEYKNQFIDTDNEKVVVLNAAEIIYGKSSTEFAPNDLLTREEAATILVRMMNKFMPMAATEVYFDYDDSQDISECASESVQVMSNLGFMNGVGENKFAPKDNYTTEQSITTLIRMYDANTYEYITPLGTITSKTDCEGHINFAIEANVRVDIIKDYKNFDETRYIITGPFKAFTDEMWSMFITFDSFAKIFNGEWTLNNNVFSFTYDTTKEVAMEKYTPNGTTMEEWPNKTDSTPVVHFSNIATILVNGEEKEIKASTGGKVYNGHIMMYNNELYIPVQLVAELLDCDIAVTDILWN